MRIPMKEYVAGGRSHTHAYTHAHTHRNTHTHIQTQTHTHVQTQTNNSLSGFVLYWKYSATLILTSSTFVFESSSFSEITNKE